MVSKDRSLVVVIRCAIDHEGFLFDKGGEALVRELSHRSNCDDGSKQREIKGASNERQSGLCNDSFAVSDKRKRACSSINSSFITEQWLTTPFSNGDESD